MKTICLSLILLFSACVSYPRTVNTISLAGHDFPLLKNNQGEYTSLQQITIKFPDKQYSFNAQVEVSQNRITIIGLTPVHSRSFLITFENGLINYEQEPFFQYPVPPESIIADFQMISTPVDHYRKELLKHSINIEEKSAIRHFHKADITLAQVKFLKNQEYEIKYLNTKYTIHIKTLSYEKL